MTRSGRPTETSTTPNTLARRLIRQSRRLGGTAGDSAMGDAARKDSRSPAGAGGRTWRSRPTCRTTADVSALPWVAVSGLLAGALHVVTGVDHLAVLLPLAVGRR